MSHPSIPVPPGRAARRASSPLQTIRPQGNPEPVLDDARRTLLLGLGASVAAGLAGCAGPLSEPAPVEDRAAGSAAPLSAAPTPGPVAGGSTSRPAPRASAAATARDYRRDAAGHIYTLHAPRIYTGKLPPLLYAIGVLQVDLDRGGHVTATRWMRAPRHAPEVMAEIEKIVQAAAPYPAPSRIGRVTWTDTWLWDKSGRFQLDTLSEGQL